MFDPNAFANSTITEPSSTQYEPIPEGEYNAVISEATPKVTPNGNALIEVLWKIDSPDNDLAHEKSVRQTVWLDVNDAGNLDMSKGKNVQLGRLREALGQNIPGEAWSPLHLAGNVAIILVKQRQVEDAIYTDVKGVTAI